MTFDPYRRTEPHERTDANLFAAIAVCRKYPTKGFMQRELPGLLAEAEKRGLSVPPGFSNEAS